MENLVENFILQYGYFSIFILMAIESVIFPLPSELVLGISSFFIKKGNLSFWGSLLSATLGSLLGSILSYFIGYIIYNILKKFFSKFKLIDTKIQKSEKFLNKYGILGVFVGRFIPALRNIISYPAGFLRLNFFLFCIFTLLGSFLWCLFLLLLFLNLLNMV